VRSCDTCPGGAECAADNLAPVLSEIHALYRSGKTNKFDILFALPDDFEELFEKYNDQLSRICWTKAALEIIAETLATGHNPDHDRQAFVNDVQQRLVTAVGAFENFPWYVAGLIGQAPDLYEEILYRDSPGLFASHMGKREFVKLCRTVIYKE